MIRDTPDSCRTSVVKASARQSRGWHGLGGAALRGGIPLYRTKRAISNMVRGSDLVERWWEGDAPSFTWVARRRVLDPARVAGAIVKNIKTVYRDLADSPGGGAAGREFLGGLVALVQESVDRGIDPRLVVRHSFPLFGAGRVSVLSLPSDNRLLSEDIRIPIVRVPTQLGVPLVRQCLQAGSDWCTGLGLVAIAAAYTQGGELADAGTVASLSPFLLELQGAYRESYAFQSLHMFRPLRQADRSDHRYGAILRDWSSLPPTEEAYGLDLESGVGVEAIRLRESWQPLWMVAAVAGRMERDAVPLASLQSGDAVQRVIECGRMVLDGAKQRWPLLPSDVGPNGDRVVADLRAILVGDAA